MRFNYNTNTPSSDTAPNSQGSPRASQRRSALFSALEGGGGKGTEKKKAMVCPASPRNEQQSWEQPQVSQVAVLLRNHRLYPCNPLGSLETSRATSQVTFLINFSPGFCPWGGQQFWKSRLIRQPGSCLGSWALSTEDIARGLSQGRHLVPQLSCHVFKARKSSSAALLMQIKKIIIAG